MKEKVAEKPSLQTNKSNSRSIRGLTYELNFLSFCRSKKMEATYLPTWTIDLYKDSEWTRKLAHLKPLLITREKRKVENQHHVDRDYSTMFSYVDFLLR